MATTATSRARSIPRTALPSAILFEERDGIFWLRGDDLKRAKPFLGLRCDGDAAGFDRTTCSGYVWNLARKRIGVGVLQGNVVRTVHLRPESSLRPPMSTAIYLAPRQLFARVELEGFARGLSHENSAIREAADKIDVELANGCDTVLRDVGTLFVYLVGDDIYEVDWELTTVPRSTVETLALTAHLSGHKLPCRLVPPRPRRGGPRVRLRAVLQITEPVPYGQLTLPL